MEQQIDILQLYFASHPDDLTKFQTDIEAIDNRSVNADLQARRIMLRLANKIADTGLFGLNNNQIYDEIKRIAGIT